MSPALAMLRLNKPAHRRAHLFGGRHRQARRRRRDRPCRCLASRVPCVRLTLPRVRPRASANAINAAVAARASGYQSAHGVGRAVG
eukprot:356314-Chlamydomonas_euryale.AAC.1